MNAREIVAWNVRRIRVLRGLSAEILAADARVDRSYMSRLERAVANPSVDVLERIAAALGIEIAELFVIPPASADRPPALPGGRRRRSD